MFRTMSHTDARKEKQVTEGPKGRMILQQCLSAKLVVTPASGEHEERLVEIQRGLVIFICFLEGATAATVESMVRTALTAKLSEADGGKLMSVLELPGDVLIIPQATLGGTLNGKKMQYHKNISREEGQKLYQAFIDSTLDIITKNLKSVEALTQVRWGTYGIRQVYSCNTNGPFMHIVDV